MLPTFDPELAEIRFGCGLSPQIAPVRTRQAMLDGLSAPDAMQAMFHVEDFPTFLTRAAAARAVWRQRRAARGTPQAEHLGKELATLKKNATLASLRWLSQSMLRCAYSKTALRERLTAFWADHFTAHGKTGILKRGAAPYIESAIRPHLTGRFADLLVAAVTHPLMIDYLDQRTSMGPNSPRAAQKDAPGGLNENLAREVLELHTLGVNGPYDQRDVHQLAKLFTGLSFDLQQGLRFRPAFAEPGVETVLGESYGPHPGLAPIVQALEDLAVHSATAAHIARKLAVHFVSDRPDAGLVGHLEAVFLRTDGDLMALYAALLEHPAAWAVDRPNMKWPSLFVASALRALAVPPMRLQTLHEKETRRMLYAPLRLMGQRWQEPTGPDGWPEADSHWITPQTLSARITWAIQAPAVLMPDLPDPRRFAETALGARLTPDVRFAASAAESKPEAIGLVLASPAFQRC